MNKKLKNLWKNVLNRPLFMFNFLNTKKGFTLLEVLMVIVIIGILSGIGISTFGGYIEKAHFIKGVSFEASVRRKMLTSLDSYVAFWVFNEEGGILRDGSYENNHILLPNNVTRSENVYPNAADPKVLEFNGNGPGIKITGNTLLPKNRITISLWFNLKRHKNYNQLFRYVDSRILIRVANNKSLCFNMTAQSGRKDVCAPEEIELNTWYHIGAIYNGEDMILYLNGNEVGRTSNPNQILNPNGKKDMWLGVGDNVGISVLDGFLDNVYIWGDSFSWD